ncbi:amidase [Paenibacillus beijingensis]|uniref:Glutamyl-tRNA amidotransferase n=1 Tax=Paenibacillus beijingensis TaxID=1126833 RepID=A0A0D5NII0_9BACL|nr:amidase family protein [Paenibacillus beijingensis]AJY74782.1 glutamyl-tRNA amidotransferase [Paenibacillus beijingensis]
MVRLYALTGAQQAKLVRDREVSPVEIVGQVFDRIHRLNPVLNAFCQLDEEHAMAAAKQAEQQIMNGEEVGPLHGVPFHVKDLVLTKGIRTAFGSKAFENYIPDEDDISVERLKNAGGIVVGKTNVPEFGYRGINKVFGNIRNPWNTELTPGGSSGGSAVAVVTGMGSLTVGSDGGGSIRNPASLTGVYGFKPSFGRVPLYPGCRDPKFPGGSSWETLEVIGPLTRTVEDSALMLSIMSGPSHMDRHSLPGTLDYMKIIQNKDIKDLRIAWSVDAGYATVDPEVRRITLEAVKVFEQLGCHVEETHPGISNPSQYFAGLIARDTDFAGLRKMAQEYGDYMDPNFVNTVNRVWTDDQLTSAAMDRQAINITMRRFMENYDLLIVPALFAPAFKVGTYGPTEIDGRSVPDNHWSSFNCIANITGFPAASLPAGWTNTGLPVGLQLIGGHLADEVVLRASSAFEEARPWLPQLNALVERYDA